jgi:hypothetical protein
MAPQALPQLAAQHTFGWVGCLLPAAQLGSAAAAKEDAAKHTSVATRSFMLLHVGTAQLSL